MSARITFKVQKNDQEWKKLQARLRPFVNEPRAEVGVVGEQASEDHGGISMGELAAVHEFGSPKNNIPERSFIRSTLESNASEYATLLRPLLQQLLEGKLKVKRVLSIWGAKASADIRARLLRGAPLSPTLSKRTIAARKARALVRQQSGTSPGKLRSSDGRFLSLKNVGLRPLVETGKLVASISWEVVMSSTERPAA
jgi:hypothetical protein